MGFFRRRQQPAVDEFKPPPGIDVPEGMTAVPVEKLTEWADQLANEASEVAVSKKAPDFVDLAAKVALPNVCGADRADAFSGGTQLLGYNLFLLGYWCRTAEMGAVAANEVSADVTGYLQVAHDRGLWGDDWFATLAGASYALAGLAEGSEDLAAAFRSALPQDLGDDFRRHYAAVAIAGISDAIDAQRPGASEPLAPAEMRGCWEVGYWMRTVAVSLPDGAHIEFGSDYRQLG
jgi:hypothetical protein